jgi:hypothetical protein
MSLSTLSPNAKAGYHNIVKPLSNQIMPIVNQNNSNQTEQTIHVVTKTDMRLLAGQVSQHLTTQRRLHLNSKIVSPY